MKVQSARWIPFRIPFVRPFATAHGVLTDRVGFLLRIDTSDGTAGFGEASIVPGFGGTMDELRGATLCISEAVSGHDLADDDAALSLLDLNRPSQAAVAFALDNALGDLYAQQAGVPLAKLLSGDPSRPVAVNATIGAPATEDAAQAAREAVAAGFRCVKLKVGIAVSEAEEVARIRAVREAIGPDAALRIDANGAWSYADAVYILEAVARLGLEYVEQPVAAEDLAGMARLRSMGAVPVAADEAVGSLEQARRVIDAGAADVLVIKPMLAGGLRRSLEIAALARKAGLGVVVTSTIDTGIGVAAALHLAAALPEPRLACGLATGSLLASDLLVQPLLVEKGAMCVPEGAGLGVRLDQTQVETFGGHW